MTPFGLNIKHLRIKAGLTQRELGKYCGLQKDAISYIETQPIKRNTIRHRILAEHLGYDLEYLNTVILDNIEKLKELAPNPTADRIEHLLIAYGHCIETKNKFRGEI